MFRIDTHKRLILTAVLVLPVLAGCTPGDYPEPRQEIPRLEVTPVYHSHKVAFDPIAKRPATMEMLRLERFLRALEVAEGDVVEVRAADTALGRREGGVLVALLEDTGYAVRYSLVEDKQSETAVTVRTLAVKLPDCPNWSDRPGRNYQNAASSNFGCATVTNLGLMVADPEDLIEGRENPDWDGVRAASSVVRYQTRTTEPILREDVATSESREE